jgi:transcriptional antiterminator Rof (Rho-off)
LTADVATNSSRKEPDAIELLCHDHRMVEQLFRDYQAAASETQRRGVVEIMVRELSKHAALEELMTSRRP